MVFWMEDEIVGAANIVFGYEEAYILNIEAVEKNRRYGTFMIAQLFDMVPIIKGEATPSSKGFWIKLGAKFDEGMHFVLKQY